MGCGGSRENAAPLQLGADAAMEVEVEPEAAEGPQPDERLVSGEDVELEDREDMEQDDADVGISDKERLPSMSDLVEESAASPSNMISRNTTSRSLARNKSPAVQMNRLRAIFQLYDEDDSGFIERDELVPLLRRVYHPDDEVIAEVLNAFDTNNDGKIDFDEFCRGVLELEVSLPNTTRPQKAFAIDDEAKEKLRRKFRRLDRDKSGLIDRRQEIEELVREYVHVSDELLNFTMDAFDKNGDGRISFNEFYFLIDKLKGDLSQLWKGAIRSRNTTRASKKDQLMDDDDE